MVSSPSIITWWGLRPSLHRQVSFDLHMVRSPSIFTWSGLRRSLHGQVSVHRDMVRSPSRGFVDRVTTIDLLEWYQTCQVFARQRDVTRQIAAINHNPQSTSWFIFTKTNENSNENCKMNADFTECKEASFHHAFTVENVNPRISFTFRFPTMSSPYLGREILTGAIISEIKSN